MSCFQTLIIAIMAITVTMAAGQQGWIDAHATFYGDMQGHETEQGACGYDVFKEGYGLQTAALSEALFQNGATCGSCYEIKCVNSEWCIQGAGSIQVTATNLCPHSTGPAAWCNPPLKHFDLSEPMFLKIAQYKGGIVPVQFRRVPCVRQGGLKFLLNGNPNWLLVLVFNVAGAGDVTGMKIKGSSGSWTPMTRNWGMKWQATGNLYGQALSFQVTASDGKTIQLDNVVPSNVVQDLTYSQHAIHLKARLIT